MNSPALTRRPSTDLQPTPPTDHRYCYEVGDGVEADAIKAVQCYKTAAESGIPAAMCSYAMCLGQSRGIKGDKETAVEWFRRAATQGHPKSMAMLGVCYEHGLGVDKDLAEATRWLRHAARQGRTASMQALARVLLTTEDEDDALEAGAWLELVEQMAATAPDHRYDAPGR